MFSSRREPAKKHLATATTSRLSATAIPSSSSPVLSPPRPRTIVRVATVTRTTVVKRGPPPPPPRVGPPPATLSKEKRKAEPTTRDASSSKSRKLERPALPKRSAAEHSDEGDDRGARRTEESSSSEDESRPLVRKKEMPSVVERDASAMLDGAVGECVSAEGLVLSLPKAYIQWFGDPADATKPPAEWAGAEHPVVTLEYPGDDAQERFLLLAPKGGDEYDPIEDLMSTIRLVLDIFLTPAQALAVFNHTPATNTSFSAFLSAPTSRSGTPSTPTDSNGTGTPTPVLSPLMRSLEKAKAKRDGPAFFDAVERYNVGLRGLKEAGAIKRNIKEMKGVVDKVWMKISAQAYERAVGPGIEALSKYEAFSSNTYGELLPKFVGEICQLTNLGPGSVFVDLGSGVGNCVVQAALATGCEAWGFENMAHASSLARTQVKEAEARFRMWGLKGGAMKTVEADFCSSPDVNRILQRADVVLVNNEVFSSELNERLSLLFLDLRQDAKIVSLKAFASSFTLSAHNQHSPLAILDQGRARKYGTKSVSWKSDGGEFFIGRIDRGILEKWQLREKRRRERAEQRGSN